MTASRLVHGFDTAYPPKVAVPGFKVVFGYVGGNTPHVWTLGEWRRFSHLYQVPIWTGEGQSHPEFQAREAVRAVKARGWVQGAKHRRAIVNDFETEVDPSWTNAFANVVKANGYITVLYGSLSFVKANRRVGGKYWGADYNGDEHLYGPSFVAEQYAGNVPFGGTQVDLSVVRASFLRHCGTGPRS